MLILLFLLSFIFLFMQAVPPVIHRDIKSNNILLDQSMRARVYLLCQFVIMFISKKKVPLAFFLHKKKRIYYERTPREYSLINIYIRLMYGHIHLQYSVNLLGFLVIIVPNYAGSSRWLILGSQEKRWWTNMRLM